MICIVNKKKKKQTNVSLHMIFCFVSNFLLTYRLHFMYFFHITWLMNI